MNASFAPRAPLDQWPVQWSDPAFGFGWITLAPVAIVTQSVPDRGIVEGVEAVQDFLDEALRLLGPARVQGAVVLHDWRSLHAIDPAARAAWNARARRPGRPFRTLGSTAIATSASRVVRMALQTSSLATQLVTGAPPTRIVVDPTGVMRGHGLSAPPFGVLERLRAELRRTG